METLVKSLFGLCESIEDCLSKQRILPALVLIYCGIDIMARLGVPPSAQVRSVFEPWVDRYLIKGRDWNFSASDLYAARCGILHQYSVDSTLTLDGKAKRIFYVYGGASAPLLEEMSNSQGANCIAVDVAELNSGFKSAIADYLEEVTADASRAAEIEDALNSWFIHVLVPGEQ